MITVKTSKPRQGKLKMETRQINNALVTVLIKRDAEDIKAEKNVPQSPRLHMQTLLNLSALTTQTKNSGLLPIALFLAAKLDRERNSIVMCTTAELAANLSISSKGITQCFAELTNQGLITKVSRSTYDISPKLAFYGTAFDWSVSLTMEGKGQAAINAHLDQLDVDIKQAEKEIFANF
jgi:hypothetical protein